MKMNHEALKQEIKEFHKQGERFLNKELTVAEFKGISGGMGVYAQRGGEQFMIRLRIPSGICKTSYLKALIGYCKKHGLTKIHLTTRQAVQLHDLSLDATCDIMEDAMEQGLYSRGGGGNFPRNVSLSPFSGIEPGEAFDVTMFAEFVNEYLMERMTSYRLPRKLKIAFSSSGNDFGNAAINDLGFIAVIENGEPRFKVYLAGGLGNNPAKAIELKETISPRDVLYHVEAVLNIFIAEGDYNNKAKARLRYVPVRMGVEEFLSCYEQHLQEAKKNSELSFCGKLDLSDQPLGSLEQTEDGFFIQRQDGLFALMVSPLNGQLPLTSLEYLHDFIKDKDRIETRLTMEESILIRNLTLEQARELKQGCQDKEIQIFSEKCLSCVGVPTCQVGMEQSQSLAKHIYEEFVTQEASFSKMPVLQISGCMNSCARHQVAQIGFAGKKKRVGDEVFDAFDVFLNGGIKDGAVTFGQLQGTMKEVDIPKYIVAITKYIESKNMTLSELLVVHSEEVSNLTKQFL